MAFQDINSSAKDALDTPSSQADQRPESNRSTLATRTGSLAKEMHRQPSSGGSANTTALFHDFWPAKRRRQEENGEELYGKRVRKSPVKFEDYTTSYIEEEDSGKAEKAAVAIRGGQLTSNQTVKRKQSYLVSAEDAEEYNSKPACKLQKLSEAACFSQVLLLNQPSTEYKSSRGHRTAAGKMMRDCKTGFDESMMGELLEEEAPPTKGAYFSIRFVTNKKALVVADAIEALTSLNGVEPEPPIVPVRKLGSGHRSIMKRKTAAKRAAQMAGASSHPAAVFRH